MSHESIKEEVLSLLSKNDLEYANHLYNQLDNEKQRIIDQKINARYHSSRFLSLNEKEQESKRQLMFISEVMSVYKKTIHYSDRTLRLICKHYCKAKNKITIVDYLIEVYYITDPTTISWYLKVLSWLCMCNKKRVRKGIRK